MDCEAIHCKTIPGWNRCDECGRFIAISDFVDGKATRVYLLPDSDYSVETYETLCPKHRDVK